MRVTSLKTLRVGLCWLGRSAADRVAATRADASQAVSASCHRNQNFCPPSGSDAHLQIRRAPRSAATWVDVINGHVSYPTARPTATRLGLCSSLMLIHTLVPNVVYTLQFTWSLQCLKYCRTPWFRSQLWSNTNWSGLITLLALESYNNYWDEKLFICFWLITF